MEQENQTTLEWLRVNAVVMSSRHLATDKMTQRTRDMAWILPDHLVEKLIFQLTAKKDHFNIGGSIIGNMIFTTDQGLIIIDPLGVRPKDTFEFNGFNILNREVSREKWVRPESIYIKRL